MSCQIQYHHFLSYNDAMLLMENLRQKRVANQIEDTILVLQHYPVITRGKRLHNIKLPNHDTIINQGIEIKDSPRGGLLTYHGPGQIVVYFIIQLPHRGKFIADFVDHLQKVLQNFLHQYHLPTQIIADKPGIWVDDKKIISIGLRVSEGVTTHGISWNIFNDLSVYRLFSPCGMSSEEVTNLASVLGQTFYEEDLQKFAKQIGNYLAEHLVPF